ncbi:uncharacterized protein LOC135361277 [Latimeria chalumnae]|uniref:uncharacterized protein LOC135361277 n=1 Tax=Latimeria chalumnae TaxID=7897 RepID=UPI00313AD236
MDSGMYRLEWGQQEGESYYKQVLITDCPTTTVSTPGSVTTSLMNGTVLTSPPPDLPDGVMIAVVLITLVVFIIVVGSLGYFCWKKRCAPPRGSDTGHAFL